MAAGSAGAGAAAAAAIAQAIRATGPMVKVAPEDFAPIVSRAQQPLVLMAPPGGFLRRFYRYATSYKGFMFYTDTDEPLVLPSVDLVQVEQIWIPG